MALPDLLPIQPFTRPVRGSVVLPGSKSITNRALLLAALCDGPVTLTGALFSEDTELMAEALRQLGFVVKEDAERKTIYVEGRSGKIPAEKATLHVGLAGTAARFLTALCAAAPSGVFNIDGVPQMRKRPMKGLFDALEKQGAKINYLGEKDFFPIELHAHGLRGGEVEIDASESSQMLSALLMVAPLASSPLQIKLSCNVRWPFVEMTNQLMMQFGQPEIRSRTSPLVVLAAQYRPKSNSYAIEPDATAASYFMALPMARSRGLAKVILKGLQVNHVSRMLQGDVRFANVIEELGGIVANEVAGVKISFGGNAKRVDGTTRHYMFREFSDTFLTLAAIAPLLDGPTTIAGVAHTRKQETDRVAGMARELIKLGHNVHEHEDNDGLTITPNLAEMHRRASQGPIEIETYGDHRFAMSFAILGCYDLLGNGQPWLTIKNPACCAKTFPNFFDVLNELRTNSHLSS